MKQLYLLLAMVFAGFMGSAQPKYIRCGADEYLNMQISQDPERGRRLEALEKRVQEYVAQKVNFHFSKAIKGHFFHFSKAIGG